MQIGIRTIILFILGVIGTLALIYNYGYSVPDLVEVRYGLPLTWGANILNTIAGPTDKWRVDPIILAIDAAFWFTALIAASAMLNYRRGKPKGSRKEQLDSSRAQKKEDGFYLSPLNYCVRLTTIVVVDTTLPV